MKKKYSLGNLKEYSCEEILNFLMELEKIKGIGSNIKKGDKVKFYGFSNITSFGN